MSGLLLRARLKLRPGRRRGLLSHTLQPPSPQSEGFALVDMLVGLTMIGVISALMMSFLSQARTIMRIEKSTELQMEVEAVSRFLETAISGAEPLPLSGSPTDQVLYLAGDSSRIGFNAVQAIGFNSSALREIAISLGDGDRADGALAVVQKTRRGGERDTFTQSDPVRLIGDVSAIKFEYLDSMTSPASWLPSWNAPQRLPAAVRFSISVLRDGTTYSAKGFARLDLANALIRRAN